MQQAIYYSNKPLKPARGHARMLGVRMAPNLTVLRGTVLAQVTAAAASDVQTISIGSGTPSSGAFVLNFNGQLVSIPYNATAAQVQTALQALANIGSGNITCTGGPLPGTPIVCTFAGQMANLLEPLMTVASSTLSAGTASVAHTTPGVSYKRWLPYVGTLVANPSAAPALTVTGSDGTLAVGAYTVTYTFVTAAGESLPSPAATIAVASTNHIAIGSITGIPTGVTSVNVYLNGSFIKNQAVTTNATGAFTLTGSATGAALDSPSVSTAFLNNDGSQIAKCLSIWDLSTDTQGRVSLGSGGGTQYTSMLDIDTFWDGVFNASDLVGLDANAVVQLNARFLRGSLGDSNAEISIPGA